MQQPVRQYAPVGQGCATSHGVTPGSHVVVGGGGVSAGASVVVASGPASPGVG